MALPCDEVFSAAPFVTSRNFPFPCQRISLYFPAQTSHAADMYWQQNIDNNSDF
ncbi:hypothetical protein EPIR_3210 [Erwinia piriflorinigrans CFBP 5888]|uniref:Uncharacterized protein n=1 Tax=Erwinia piriflorinigrans CFBP 5888 TaxID=1161919 RepID=V5ZB26_9GAMM|nr:hypothetical protein EPIR_3210 [Erwinia piriflorinigrans CFBP 5888]